MKNPSGVIDICVPLDGIDVCDWDSAGGTNMGPDRWYEHGTWQQFIQIGIHQGTDMGPTR